MEVEKKEIVIRGRVPRIAYLRHEWCDFISDPPAAIASLRKQGMKADIFSYIDDICTTNRDFGYWSEPLIMAVLRLTTYEAWWNDIGFKARNKIRKGQKSGVDVRLARLDDEFAEGVEAIYNESPVRQGRKFYHYGKRAPAIRDELSSFSDKSILLGAYIAGELVGFTKLFEGQNVLRTVHIIAKIAHRDKCPMDIMMAKAVELCATKNIANLHYGTWTDGGVGAFRTKYNFERVENARYFVPLNAKGRLMLALRFHTPLRSKLPTFMAEPLLTARSHWNSVRYRQAKELAD